MNGKAVKKILENRTCGNFSAYSGRDGRTGLALHAKLIFFKNTMVLGSANLTAQALGTTEKTINHEVIFLKKKGEKDRKTILRNFEKIDINDFENESPGDRDPEEDLMLNVTDWKKEREARIKAPERCVLKIKKGEAYIELIGNWESGKIFAQSLITDKSVALLLFEEGKKKYAAPAKENKHLYAEILSKGNVEIQCKKYGKIVWKTALDYGDFWQALELQGRFNGGAGNGNGSSFSKTKQKKIVQYDVRDMRQIAIKDPRRGAKIAPFVRWLNSENISVAHIPKWCQDLANKIKEKK